MGSAAIPAPGGAPTLRAALHNEEQAYLGRTFLPGQTISEADIQPWGGVSQQPDINGLLTLSSIPTNIPICAAEQAILPTAPVNTTILTIPHLTAGTLSFLPRQVLNAVRLEHGKITACWTAYADSFNADGSYTFTTTITYSYMSNDGTVNDQLAQTSASVNNVPDCTNPNSFRTESSPPAARRQRTWRLPQAGSRAPTR